jgi:hypothetical protein
MVRSLPGTADWALVKIESVALAGVETDRPARIRHHRVLAKQLGPKDLERKYGVNALFLAAPTTIDAMLYIPRSSWRLAEA